MRMTSVAWLVALGVECTFSQFVRVEPAEAAARYHLIAKGVTGIPQELVFALTCSDSGANTVTIVSASSDGSQTIAIAEGGPLRGDLFNGSNPADTTVIESGAFYGEIGLLLSAVTRFDCDVLLSEQAPSTNAPAAEFALYVRDQNDQVRVTTVDPTGVNALAAIDINGDTGGELFTFEPLSFIAPDTLLLDGSTVGVGHPSNLQRLRFVSISPNPSHGAIDFTMDVPSKGDLRLCIYDIAGRRVAEPINLSQLGGRVSLRFDSRLARGGRLLSGTYVAELRFGKQTAVRRFILVH